MPGAELMALSAPVERPAPVQLKPLTGRAELSTSSQGRSGSLAPGGRAGCLTSDAFQAAIARQATGHVEAGIRRSVPNRRWLSGGYALSAAVCTISAAMARSFVFVVCDIRTKKSKAAAGESWYPAIKIPVA